MSTIKSSNEHLTLNADGSSKDIKLQSNASEKVIVKSDGKVGIGTSSPADRIHLNESDATSSFIRFSNSNVSNGWSLGANNSGRFQITQNGVADRLAISTGGVLSAPVGIELGSGIDATAANTLDDYEEGTWTPSGTNVRSSSVGHYTKIGNMCWIQGWIYVEAAGSTGNSIGGLPFTSASTGNANGGGTPLWVQSDITGLYVTGSNTTFNLYGGSNRSTSTPMSASTQMHFVLQYITT